MIKSIELNGILDSEIMEKIKTPHGLSLPVLRREGDNIYIAVFVFFYDKKDLDAGVLHRPVLWALADIETGALVKRYHCVENDFSESKLNLILNVNEPVEADATDEYINILFDKFDKIREKLVETGDVDMDMYKDYFQRLQRTIPPSYQRFFDELNNIGDNLPREGKE